MSKTYPVRSVLNPYKRGLCADCSEMLEKDVDRCGRVPMNNAYGDYLPCANVLICADPKITEGNYGEAEPFPE